MCRAEKVARNAKLERILVSVAVLAVHLHFCHRRKVNGSFELYEGEIDYGRHRVLLVFHNLLGWLCEKVI